MKLSKLASAREEVLKAGRYQPSTLVGLHQACEKLRRFLFEEFDDEEFDLDRGKQYLKKVYGLDVDKTVRELTSHEKSLLRMIKRLENCRLTGYPFVATVKTKTIKLPEGEFGVLYARYDKALSGMELTDVTRNHYRTIGSKFLEHLRKQGLDSPSQIHLENCHCYLNSLAGFTPWGIRQILCGMRHLLRFMLRENIVACDIAPKLKGPRISKLATLPSVWTIDELRRLLDAVDRTKPCGKRDYAMLALGCVLGVRAIDVKKLRLGDFDWTAKTLRFEQHKTHKTVELPIPDPLGWALIDYIKDGRPDGKTDVVFLSQELPFTPLKEGNHLSTMMKKYRLAAGIGLGHKRGFHSLRHSAATLLLEQGTPLPAITEILGHSSSDITNIYLKKDTNRLSECVLDPEDFENGQ